ncbi:MAG: S46 family peptidase [Gemmatimonadaceae bacterium]
MQKHRRFLNHAVGFAIAAGVLGGCTPVQTAPVPVASAPAAASQASPPPLSAPGYKPEFGTMWTFEAPPLNYWKTTYNFAPDQRWLDHVRLASVRLPNCSASFVSGSGLVMTNHHCARECIEESSSKDSNYIQTGFAAANLRDEKKCAGLYVDQLISIAPVTDRVRAAITAATPAERALQRGTVVAAIQQECAAATSNTCQVVSLYQGGIYSLYRYKRYADVRLVMAPEGQIAFFGGDPDNFTFPRFDLDLTLLRVYDNDAPFKPADFLKWSAAGPVENEAVFVVGNPGSTGRLNTVSQMEFLRDVQYPATLASYSRQLGIYRQLSQSDTAAARKYQNDVFGISNSEKAVTGYRAGLLDGARAARKLAFENEFRARINADPALRTRYGTTWDAIAASQKQLSTFNPQLRYHGFAGGSQLVTVAAQIVRLATEAPKPSGERLAPYRGQGLEAVKGAVTRDREFDLAYERLALAAQLRAAQSELPASDPYLRIALAGRTPEAAAAALIDGTTLGTAAARRALVDGGMTAVTASTDPLIVLARAVDPLNRTVIARADSLNAIIASNAENIGQALFAAYGTALPPDATFTLRISDGVVKGYPYNGTIAPFKTTFFGLYDRSSAFDNKDPFNLPLRWTRRRDRLDMNVGFNFVSTNDIIGGNSGSPVINRSAEVVGLAFDSNIEGVPNRFLFDAATGRTVSVHSAGIVEALRKMYDGGRIADELQGVVTRR